MFKSLLIANRGEIAARVIRTARRMGIRTIAVYSDADAGALHVREADEAVHIGAAPARESYLNIEAVIDAAKRSHAQAIHPGYGFLSENADFAEACTSAKLVFVGPPASAIRAMGSKSASKELMAKAQVPLVPGYHGAEQSPDHLAKEARKIGYPVLIKASAGGGGKGMKIVNAADEFPAQLASAQREAQSAFGDAKVLIEKYLARPRHVEIQVFADTHGNCIHLFERDCSIQRRHQKVIEEAPAPGMISALRARMGEAAIAAARAVHYVGAGTVEFLLNEDGQFYFMEMNTRLQVEHPVTELITGLDLVEWQLRVAAGEKLPLAQDDVKIAGHAIEARLYAEDPDREFLPQAGRIGYLDLPVARLDHAVEEGTAISPYYDPMIGKLAVWGHDRDQAAMRLAEALRETEISGIVTNVPFLAKLVTHPEFRSGAVDTGFIDRNRADLLPSRPPPGSDELLLAALGLLRRTDDELGPWDRSDGFRLNASPRSRVELTSEDGKQIAIELTHLKDGYQLSDGTKLQAVRIGGHRISAEIAGRQLAAAWIADHGSITVIRDGVPYLFHRAGAADAVSATGSSDRVLRAPMPGKIAAVLVTAGDSVAQGQPLCVLEAMKMEHILKSPRQARIEAIACQPGQQVKEGAELLRFAEEANR
jgi:3-methylcrotonyl-CoA carboxylase alpha subunit